MYTVAQETKANMPNIPQGGIKNNDDNLTVTHTVSRKNLKQRQLDSQMCYQ